MKEPLEYNDGIDDEVIGIFRKKILMEDAMKLKLRREKDKRTKQNKGKEELEDS